MILGAVRRLAVPVVLLVLLLVLRPGVVVNALRSPAAWATAAAVALLAFGVRTGLRRAGAGDPAARRTASGVVALCLVLLLAPSFRQRTLVEALPVAAPVTPAASPLPSAAASGPTGAVAGPAPAPVPARSTAPSAAAVSGSSSPRATTTARRAVARSQPRAVPSRAAASATRPSPVPAVTPPAPRPAPAAFSPQAAAAPEPAGSLEGIGHRARGRVVLRTVEGQAYAVLQDIDVEGTVGPSVHLVPAGQRDPGGGPRLGALKAEKGTFSYRLPAGTDLSRSWTLLIWCDPYDTPIAAADLT